MRMMKSLRQLLSGYPPAVVDGYRFVLLVGLLIVPAVWFGLDYGYITAIGAIVLGASGGAFTNWETESGLWMLSTVFLVIFLPVFAIFSVFLILQLWLHLGVDIPLLIDATIGVILLFALVRFLLTITMANWKLSRQHH